MDKGSRKQRAGISYFTCKDNVSAIGDDFGDIPILLCIPLCKSKNFGSGKET